MPTAGSADLHLHTLASDGLICARDLVDYVEASIRGDIEPTDRVMRTMWEHVGNPRIAAVFGEDSELAFPVGALPSLHAAAPFMVLLFFWDRAPRWRPVLVAYNLAMAGTLVYTADHFVFDILLGWGYATAVHAGANRITRRAGGR